MSVVPEEWTRMLGNLRAALIERDVMRSQVATQQMRDAATDRYCSLVDAMVDDLDVLSTRLELGRITAFLSKKERS